MHIAIAWYVSTDKPSLLKIHSLLERRAEVSRHSLVGVTVAGRAPPPLAGTRSALVRATLAEVLARAAATAACAQAAAAGRPSDVDAVLDAARQRALALLPLPDPLVDGAHADRTRAFGGLHLRGSHEVPQRHSLPISSPSRWVAPLRWARNCGVALVVAFAYQLWGTGLLEARSQGQLARDFEERLSGQRSIAVAPVSLATPAPPAVALPSPLEGEAVAMLRIPAIDLEKAVVEGAGPAALRQGPGHYAATPLPGDPGNVGIAGHRTTYGAPFGRLDELVPGDTVLLTTVRGQFRYEVTEPPRVVQPDDLGVLGNHGDDRLTLTTCNPEFSAAERLVVVAKPVDGLR